MRMALLALAMGAHGCVVPSGPIDTPFAVPRAGTPGTRPLWACQMVTEHGHYTELTLEAACAGGTPDMTFVVGGIIPPDRPPPPGTVALHQYALPPPARGLTYRTGDADPAGTGPSAPSGYQHDRRIGWVVPGPR